MKVLQTLGRYGGGQEGIFQYRRTKDGVVIDSSVGQATLHPSQIQITTQEWCDIISALNQNQHSTFRLTGKAPFNTPPHQSVWEIVKQALPNPCGGWKWHQSWASYVAAILEHEGTLDLYHGPLGNNNLPAIICLKRDI